MYRNIAYVEPCQLAGSGSFSNLAIDGVREWHYWPVLGDLWNHATCPGIGKETDRRPEIINFGIVLTLERLSKW